MLEQIASNYECALLTYAPFPSASDTAAWNALDRDWKEQTIRLAEQYLHFDYPHLSATDFMDFTRTGNRVRYEDRFFQKRHALNALVLAECVENKGQFLDDIINGIFSICEESAWQLPPHNSYIRDMPQLPLPDASAPVLDLFACETGAVLATVYYLLADKLDEISPFIKKRIASELEHRVFTPYLNTHFWWMGNGREPMNNWTIWCTQNVLLSFFLTCSDQALLQKVLVKACQSADYFLDEYGEDGCCDEGAQYYRHAGLCLFNTLEIVNAVTGNSFASVYPNPKIKNMAAYIMNVHIHDLYYLNFADCSPVAGRAGVREFLFAKRIENASMMRFAARDFVAGLPETLILPTENNLFYRLQNAFTIREIRGFAQQSNAGISYPDLYYPSVGVFIARDDTLYLAVKAGDNDDSHNHNDTGSFTIYKDGKPLLIDVGVESYTKKTFSPRRYEIWTMQSAYHNLPTINGQLQQDGEQYKAREVSYSLTDQKCEIQMELADAYPKQSGLLSYVRRACLLKGREIVIQDTFRFHENVPVVLSLMTYEQPVPEKADGALCLSVGTAGTLRITGGTLHSIETIPINDPRLQICWKHEIYRILVDVESPELEIRVF